MTVYRTIRLLLYACVPLIVVIGVVIDVNPSGVRTMRSMVGESSSLISQFFPAQRLERVESGVQMLRAEPVYVTVRYPHRYETADVQVMVDNPRNLSWKIGLALAGVTEWRYALLEPDASGSVHFALDRARLTDGRIRLMVAVPGGVSGHEFGIRGITVRFERTPLQNSIMRKIGL